MNKFRIYTWGCLVSLGFCITLTLAGDSLAIVFGLLGVLWAGLAMKNREQYESTVVHTNTDIPSMAFRQIAKDIMRANPGKTLVITEGCMEEFLSFINCPEDVLNDAKNKLRSYNKAEWDLNDAIKFIEEIEREESH